jgi:hypothetical protein
MSKPNPKTDMDTTNTRAEHPTAQHPGSALRRQAFLYLSTLVSGAALVAVIYFLRLDTFAGRTKAFVDLVMVAVAVGFLVSLYMAVDSTLKKPGEGSTTESGGER